MFASSVTPSLEILRDLSTTPYQDDEVWVEFQVQMAGEKAITRVSDRMALSGTPANQSSGMGLSGWTNEDGNAWSGQLSVSTLTLEPGSVIRARVCVGIAGLTVWVDPTLRGLS